MPSRNYSDLLAWQKAVDLAEAVYRAPSLLPTEERYGLTSQMRRAVVSVSANIAEGQGRRTYGEFLNQLSVSHGSLRELETHVIIATRMGMLEGAMSQELLARTAEVGRLVRGLMNALERQL